MEFNHVHISLFDPWRIIVGIAIRAILLLILRIVITPSTLGNMQRIKHSLHQLCLGLLELSHIGLHTVLIQILRRLMDPPPVDIGQTEHLLVPQRLLWSHPRLGTVQGEDARILIPVVVHDRGSRELGWVLHLLVEGREQGLLLVLEDLGSDLLG